ncbi:TetR/AcrR family transcriptional regulator [Pseudonocardia alni]|uniref:TetR/AcrR family transcriptional regulator n=1 Tax=Pseudonocardia alni TaxID=33907 RepID=UPI0033E973C1
MSVTGGPEGRTLTQAARRQQLIWAAVEVIAEVGLPAASFARIAGRAGVSSTRMVSYHFTNRDELIEAVFSEVFRRAGEFIEPYVVAREGPDGQIAGLIEGNARFAAQHPTAVIASREIWASHRRPDGSRRYGPDIHDLELDVVGQILTAGQESGHFRQFDVRLMALTLRHALNGLMELIAVTPGIDVDHHIDEHVALFGRAMQR